MHDYKSCLSRIYYLGKAAKLYLRAKILVDNFLPSRNAFSSLIIGTGTVIGLG